MSWFRRHARELAQGALYGLLAGIVVCIVAWDACPAPAYGQTEASVIDRWGPPDQVLEADKGLSGGGVRTMRKLMYRCGLFGTSLALIYVDSDGRVADVVHGRP